MRKMLLIVLLILYSGFINSQSLSSIDTGKYRIDLPAYWKKGNKIWSILNDKLPLASEELKTKELCGDGCNPKYIVAFEITNPVFSDHYFKLTVSADSSESWKSIPGNNFSFRASLLLLNNEGELLTRFIIVDTNEVWPLYEKNPPRPRAQKITQKIADPVLTTASIPGARSRDQLPIYNDRYYTIYNYEGNSFSKKGNGPDEKDLFIIVDKKIRSW